jgi:hypothetical protein
LDKNEERNMVRTKEESRYESVKEGIKKVKLV